MFWMIYTIQNRGYTVWGDQREAEINWWESQFGIIFTGHVWKVYFGKESQIIPTSQISKKALLLMVENNLLGALICHMSSVRKFTMVILALNWEVWGTKSPAGRMATHSPEISKIKQNWNLTARPYDEGTFNPLDITADWLFDTYIHTYIHTCMHAYIHTYIHIHTCLLLLISMLWHWKAISESKGDKLSSSAECRIRTQGLRHLFARRLNACWQTDWAIEDQAK